MKTEVWGSWKSYCQCLCSLVVICFLLPRCDNQNDSGHGQVSPGEGCVRDPPAANQCLIQFIVYFLKKTLFWNGKVAPWVETLVTMTDDLSLIPGNHMMAGGSWCLEVVLWPPHGCHGTHATPSKINKPNNQITKIKKRHYFVFYTAQVICN